MNAADCSVDGCERPARPDLASGLCEMHYRRSLRGRPLDAPAQEKLPPGKRLEVAVIRVGDVDTGANDDRAYELAMECVKQAARRWMKANGWRPARDAVQRNRYLETQEVEQSRARENSLAQGAGSRAPGTGARDAQSRQDVRRDRDQVGNFAAGRSRAGHVGAGANQDRDRRGRRQGSRAGS